MQRASSPPLPAAPPAAGGAPPSGRSDAGPWPVAVQGLAFEPIALAAILSRITAAIHAHAGFHLDVATLGRLAAADSDRRVHAVLAAADLIVPGDRTLTGLTRWLGYDDPHRLQPRALVAALAALARRQKWRVFLISDVPERVVALHALFHAADADREVIGLYSPPPSSSFNDPELAARVGAARADLILAVADSPAFDLWCARHNELRSQWVMIRLPGPPTPLLPSPHHQAWRTAWRALCSRPLLLRDRRRAAAATWRRAPDGWLEVGAGTELTRRALRADPELWLAPRLAEGPACVDASRITTIDATGVALLSRAAASARRHGHPFVLLNPTAAVYRALDAARLLDQVTIAASREEVRRLARPPATRGITRSLAWCGDILAVNAEDVWQMTSEYARGFAADGATLIIVDLARVRFIDTAGAALMLRVKRWGHALRAEILFTHAQAQVAAILRLTSADWLVLEGAQ